MRKLSLLLVFLLIFSSVYLPIGVSADETDGLVETYWDAPPVTPPNVHPRVFFTEDKIEGIRNNIDAEENAIAKELLMKYVNVGLSANGIVGKTTYDETVLAQIEACAFYYAIYKGTGNDTKAQTAGQEAVDSIEMIKAMEVTGSDPQRKHGRKLNVLSEVYDWCYPLIKDDADLITDITNTGVDLMMQLEIWDGVSEDKYNGNVNEDSNPYYSPGSLGPLVGHGMEKENLRDLLSFAIAFSDVRPDIWTSFGGRFYQRFVPARQFLIDSGYYQSGTDYGIAREYATACAYFLITGMGAPEPWSGEGMAKNGYANIYLRRPDGAYLYDGDVYTNTIPPFDYSVNSNYNPMHMYAAAASDEDAGYLKGEYFKMGIDMSSASLTQSFYENSPIINLIVNNPEIEAKTVQNLPNSKYFPSPAGVMTARTGWEEGIDSSAVVANMKINEYNFAGHHHNDSGHFSIYYKGLLATDGGNYTSFGNEEHAMYTKKSIAHNTMLIYDPSEGNFTDIAATNINDGGQVTKYNGATSKSVEQFIERNKASDVLAQEIDPENTQRPYYTYIKGELKNAYKDELNYPDREKVEEFKRSFMFLDLKDEKIPAALIVFDKVVSSDAKFKKMWLLHGVNKPTVENGVTTFTNTDKGYSGKMVNKTLLPKSANFEVVGGPKQGWGVVRGWKYNDTTGTWDITNSVNYGANSTADKTENNERNTYRLEVSPTTPNKEDHFLNVILVGDAGEQIDANVPLYEDNENFYGTMVEDRVVFFSRDGAKKNSFSYNISGSGTKRYTICDMEKGTYTVTVGGSTKEVSVSEEGGVLSFTGACGQVSAVMKNTTYTKPTDSPYEILNDRAYVRNGSSFVKSGEEETDGVVTEIESFAELFGYNTVTSTENSKKVIKIYNGLEFVATVIEGDAKIQTKSGTLTSSVGPYLNEDGKLVMSLAELSRILNSESRYLDYAKTFYIYNFPVKPEDIFATGNIKDGILTVNVKVYNGYNTDIYCGLLKENQLIVAQKLYEVDYQDKNFQANNCYSTKIDISKLEGYDSSNPSLEGYEVKLYAWGDELYPIAEAMTMEETSELSKQSYDGKYKFHTSSESDMYGTTNATSTQTRRINENGKTERTPKFVVDRASTVTDPKASVVLNTTKYNQFYFTEGYMHYVTNLRVNKLTNDTEYMQTWIRGMVPSGATGATSAYSHKTFEGAEYKIDVIIDLVNDKGYIYENGELVKGEISLANWERFTSIDHYLINGGGTIGASQFEVFDSSMRFYPPTAKLEDIQATIGKFLILK